MPTNQQRRDAAKRKLERQLVRREEAVRSRRQRTIILSVIAGVVVLAGAIWFITKKPAETDTSASGDSSTSSAETPSTACSYPATSQSTVKPVAAPDNTNPLTSGTVDATITLSQGALPVTLDRSLAPCAVNAFISLAAQKFYDGTSCHRLTADANLKILQCGDPSGTGRGGPGFGYAAETNPEVTDPAADPTAAPTASVVDQYPVGTLAMANTGTGSDNGSQFFVVYGESDLGASGYTKIGTVSADGLAVVDQIAAKGTVVGNNPNGAADAPAEAVNVTSVTVPDDATVPTQPAPETTDVPTDGLSTDGLTEVPSDSVSTDTVPTDAGATDAGSTDAGSTDAGSTGAGTTDASSTAVETSPPAQ